MSARVLPPHIKHRCSCTPSVNCPGPTDGHGSFEFHIEDSVRPDGKRKQIHRRGFASISDAQTAMRSLQEALPSVRGERARSRAYWWAAAEMLIADRDDIRLSRTGDASVYIARGGNYLKIGYSANPAQRIAQIRMKPSATRRLISPSDLDRSSVDLWLFVAGTRADEDALHWLARNYHMCGEWFFADAPLLAALEACMEVSA